MSNNKLKPVLNSKEVILCNAANQDNKDDLIASNKLTIIKKNYIQNYRNYNKCKSCNLQYCNGERHVKRPFIYPTCKLCGIELNDIIELLSDQSLRNQYSCEMCDKKYVTDENINIHFLSHFYQSEYESKFSCLKCKNITNNKPSTNNLNGLNNTFNTIIPTIMLSQLPSIDKCIKNKSNAQEKEYTTSYDNEITKLDKNDELIHLVGADSDKLHEEIICKCTQCGAECMTQKELDEHEFMDHDGPSGYTVDIFSSKYDQNFSFFETEYFIDKFEVTDNNLYNSDLNNTTNDHTLNDPDGIKTYDCEFCNDVFQNIKEMRNHYRSIHPNADICYAQCRLCSEQFLTKTRRFLHERENHINVITKTYDCDLCSLIFKNPSSLIYHYVTHLNKTFYICEYCGKSFKRFKSLTGHVSLHANDQDRLYKCDICKRSYSTPAGLKYHMTGHSGATPYNCNYCPKKYRDASDLRRHIRVHINVEKRFVCVICKKSFYEKKELNHHMKRHSCVPDMYADNPKKRKKNNMYIID